jgi:hypothetical protein
VKLADVIESGMASRDLTVIAGELAKSKQKAAPAQDALAKRWRMGPAAAEPARESNVIPLLDGWIRRLEREAGSEAAER